MGGGLPPKPVIDLPPKDDAQERKGEETKKDRPAAEPAVATARRTDREWGVTGDCGGPTTPEEVAVAVGLRGAGAAVGDEARVKGLDDEPGASWVGCGSAVEVPNCRTCTSLQP